MKKIIVLVVVVAVAAGGVYYWKYRQAALENSAAEVTTAKVKRGPIVQAVSTTGRVVANLDVEIKCKASGQIVSLPFDVSDPVKKGDLLLELDPVDEQRAERQSEVALSASEARLAQAKQNLEIAQRNLATEKKRAQAALDAAQARQQDASAKCERLAQLLDKKLASQEEFETAKTSLAQAAADLENSRVRMEELETQEAALELKRQDVSLAEAEVESDKIALSIAQQRLRDTQVYAPIDGVVAIRNVQIGQIISSGISNVGGGTTVMVLSDLSRIFALATVDESDIGAVKLGQNVRVTVDAFPRIRFEGEVKRISTRGVSASSVVTFEVKIEVLGDGKTLLKPEMTANVEITIAEERNALQIPADAVFRKEGKSKVLVNKPDGTSEERVVEVGITDGASTQILKGLDEGDTVTIKKNAAESRWSSSQGLMMFGAPPSGRSQGGTRR
jgi:HlyD family secretion protein